MHDLETATLYGLRALDAGEVAAFEAHLETCALCRAEVTAVAAMVKEIATKTD